MKALLLTSLALVSSIALAAPKADDANRAVVSIVSYDATGKILHNSYGYYCSERAEVLAPYTALRAAVRAEVIDWKGERHQVLRLVGASENYDLVRFTTNAPLKSLRYLRPSLHSSFADSTLAAQCYYTNEKKERPIAVRILHTEQANNYAYYTISTPNETRYQGCPLIDDAGGAIGVMQSSVKADQAHSYAIDARLADSLHITSAAIFNADLNGILIPKQLPTTSESEAFSYLYVLLRSQQSPQLKATALSDFQAAYPQHAELPFETAIFHTRQGNYAQADAALRPLISQAPKATAARAAELLSELILFQQQNDSLHAFAPWTAEAALQAAQQAENLDPSENNLLQTANVLSFMRQSEAAAQKYLQATQLPEATWRSFERAAQAQLHLGASNDRVFALYDSCVARMPQTPPAEAAEALFYHGVLANSCGKARQGASSLETYERLIGTGTLARNFYHLRSEIYFQARMYQQAVDDLHTAIARSQNQEERSHSQISLAELYLRLNEWASSKKLLDEVLSQKPNQIDALKLMGLWYGEQKQPLKARPYFQKAANQGDAQAKELLQKYNKK